MAGGRGSRLSSRPVTPPRASKLWLLLPALLAFGWFLPVLWHGFRSDDFLTVYYYDRDAETVKWGRVFEEWVRPWFGVRDLYRPVVSLSFGVNWALSPSPFGFHLGNVLLLAGTATAVAAAAARLAPARPRLAGLVAAALVVLHPAAVEPTAWIAARTTGLQVFWSALAYLTFLRWRDGDGGRWWPLLATALACASKEGAVLLPASLLALDLLRGARPAWRTHLPFALLVGGYLLFRWWLLGVATTAADPQPLGERLASGAALLQQLVLPPAGGAAAAWWQLAPLAALGLAALGSARAALWCVPWAALLMLPGTTHVQLAPNELAGRFVFDGVPALALFSAVVIGRQSARVGLLVGGAAALGLLALLANASLAHLHTYGEQDRVIRKVQHELLAAAEDAGQGRPFGVVGLPKLPLLQPALWGFLTQRPFAPVDLPVVGLDHMLTLDPGAKRVFTDATAVHALVANGAGFGRWDGATERLVLLPKAADEVVEFVRDPVNARRFVPPRLLPPTAVAAIEVVAPNPMTSLRAEVLGNLEGDYAVRPMGFSSADAAAPGVSGAQFLDTTGVLPWLVAASFGGGAAGIELMIDDKEPVPGVTVRSHAVLPEDALPTGPSGTVERAALADWSFSDGTDRRPRTLYLLLPTGLYAAETLNAGRIVLEPAVLQQLDFLVDVLGPSRVHWFTQRNGLLDAMPARSGFGTCIVR